LYDNVRLSYFTIICNNHEYKKMDPGLSQGQLYDVHNEIYIFEKHWLGLLIYYDISCKILGFHVNFFHGTFQNNIIYS
jgi:hypothetical protein